MSAPTKLSLLLLLVFIAVAWSTSEDGTTIGLHMIHRSSPKSPSWKPHYSNPTNILRDSIRRDRRRLQTILTAWRRSLAGSSSSALLPTTARVNPPLASQEEALVSSRLVSGSYVGNGEYFAELKVGTPPRKFPLIVDTGSDLTWLQCIPPKQELSPTYNRSSSSSFKPIPCTADECSFLPAPNGSVCSRKHPSPCDYTYGYSDTSATTGILGYETIHMKLKSSAASQHRRRKSHARIENVAIGCGLEVSGSSFTGASGVLGLGQGPVSFPSQVGKIFGGSFSYCLVNYLAPGGSNVSSELVFGRPRGGFPGMKYTPIVRNPVVDGFYYVNVIRVEVNGVTVPRTELRESWSIDKDGNGGTVFDSGTTLSFLREPAYSRVMEALRGSIRLARARKNLRGFELCYNVSGVKGKREMEEAGELSVVFHGGAVLRAPANNFLVLVDGDVKCVSIRRTEGFNVIGNLLQQDFRVEYDLQNARIGLKWSPCSKK